jgi:hypothetical protein
MEPRELLLSSRKRLRARVGAMNAVHSLRQLRSQQQEEALRVYSPSAACPFERISWLCECRRGSTTCSAAPPRLHPLGCDVMSPSESLDMVDEGASGVL